MTLSEELEDMWKEEMYTRYHEAGHAVAEYLLRFRPVLIDGATASHDRRTSAFLRADNGSLSSARTRERADDYAVAMIAGPAAQARISGRILRDLREESDKHDDGYYLGDYFKVYALMNRKARSSIHSTSEALFEARLNLLE